MKRLSESRMHALWRKAVLIKHFHACAFCEKYGDENLQCHHIVYRRKLLTRWDWKNGIALCHECHRKAHTKAGEIMISKKHPYYDDLIERENLISKDLFVRDGVTNSEYYRLQADEMTAIIKGER